MPYILSKPYHNFVKEIPLDEVATPSYIVVFFVSYFSTFIQMSMTVLGYILLSSSMDILQISTAILYTLVNLMSLIAIPMPFLVIGSATSYLVNQCEKNIIKKEIDLVATTLKNYKMLTENCGPALLTIFTMNVVALIIISYMTAISLKGCNVTAFELEFVASLLSSLPLPAFTTLVSVEPILLSNLFLSWLFLFLVNLTYIGRRDSSSFLLLSLILSALIHPLLCPALLSTKLPNVVQMRKDRGTILDFLDAFR